MHRIRLTFRYYSYLIHAPDAEWQVNHNGVNEFVFNTGQCLGYITFLFCIALADIHFRGSSAQSRWYSNLNVSFRSPKHS